MVQTTPAYAFPYPENGDSPTVPTHVQNLAQAIEALLQGNPTIGGNLTVGGNLTINGFGWTSFSPNVYTNMATTPSTISRTVVQAKFRQLGKVVWAFADVTLGAATTNGIGIALPTTAAVRVLNCGSCALFGTSPPADQSGVAAMASTLDRLVVVAYTNGFRDGASGQSLRYSVCYEAA